MASASIVKEGPGEALPPVFEHGHQRAACESGRKITFETLDYAKPGNGGRYFQVDGGGDERSGRADPHDLAVAFEFPRNGDAARKAMADAGVAEQILRVIGPAMRRQIGGRGRRRVALDSRTDRHRDHVLLQPLVVADAGVEACGQHIDEAVLGGDLHRDSWIRLQEALHDGGQNEPGDGGRHIEPERTCEAVAEAVDSIDRRRHLAQCRDEAFQQPGARLGRRHAACRTVEEAHAEPHLQPAYGLAQGRGRGAAHGRGATKAAMSRDRRKGVEVGKVRFGHCSVFRTTCFSNDGLSNAGPVRISPPIAPVNSRPFALENIICNIAALEPTVPPSPPSASAAWACRACTARRTGTRASPPSTPRSTPASRSSTPATSTAWATTRC